MLACAIGHAELLRACRSIKRRLSCPSLPRARWHDGVARKLGSLGINLDSMHTIDRSQTGHRPRTDPMHATDRHSLGNRGLQRLAKASLLDASHLREMRGRRIRQQAGQTMHRCQMHGQIMNSSSSPMIEASRPLNTT